MSEASDVRFGPFRLIGRYGPLLRGTQEVKLQRKALAVLWTLASQPGEPVTRSSLMDAVWPGAIVGDEVLTYQIKALRQAIEEDPRNPRYILTAHRIGFRFVIPEAVAPPQESKASALFGRESETQSLLASYGRANGGSRQFFFVCGEAGIGKTALIDDFLVRLRSEAPDTRIYRGQSLEVTGESEAYQPLFDALDQGIRSTHGEELLEGLRLSAPSWLRQMPRLLTGEELQRLKRITAGTPPERQRRELVEAIEHLAGRHTLVLVIEDLHWSDASTVALLGLLAQREEPARLLVICSCRPVETILAQHPARSLQLNLAARGLARAIHLQSLLDDAARRLIERQIGDAGTALTEGIMRRGGGHPLFLVHLSEYLRNRTGEAGPEAVAESELPPQLRELIELQLSHLSVSEQLMLEVGAVGGQEFSAAAVAAGSGLAVEAVEEVLESMAQRSLFIAEHGLAIWPDGTVSGRFRFRHSLHGFVLRQRLGGSRQARLHRRLAERLEAAWAGRSAEIATELAQHYESGGLVAKAAECCIQTGQNALERLAAHEVREQVARGLALLASLRPDLARHRIELRLRIVASFGLQLERGYFVGSGYDHRDRIDTLIELVGDDPLRIPAVEVQWVSRHFNMEFERAISLAESLRDFGRAAGLPQLEFAGLGWAAHSLHSLGRHEQADRYVAESYRLALLGGNLDGVDLGAFSSALSIYPVTRWFLGFPEQALTLANYVYAVAERQENPYTRCMATSASLGLTLEFTRNHERLLVLATDTLELARRSGHMEGQRWASVLLGSAQLGCGDPEASLRTLVPVLDEMRRLGLVIQVPMGLVAAARAWSILGEHARALDAVEQALQLIRQRGHRPWEPEALRAMGELQLAARPRAIAAAMVPIWEALELARSRKALSLELRAATSLARLHQRQGKTAEALALLEPVLDRFTEGFELPDLREARVLNDSLRT